VWIRTTPPTELAMAERLSTIAEPTACEQKQGVEVSVSESIERWSDFTLDDGSVVRAKAMVMSAFRLDGEFDVYGRPVYVLGATFNSFTASSPAELMKVLSPGCE
jgi:hypothetical protein